MLKALIFDFDGVIVDTEPLHYQAFQKILEPLGFCYSWDDYIEYYMGFDDREAFREVFRRHSKELIETELESLISQKAKIFLDIIQEGIKAYSGAVNLVKELSGNIPLALCSGALVSDIYPILDQLGIADKFDVIVSAEDVSVSKPDPESYRLAQYRLNLKYPDLAITPENCLAIEDTPAGIESAKAAGISVLAVTNSFKREKLTEANYIIDSLEMITLHKLKEIIFRSKT